MLPPGATTDQLPSTVDDIGPIGTCEARHLQLGVTLRFHVRLILPGDECARIGTTKSTVEEVKDQSRVL
jgi:hypothetical protein